VVEYDGYLYLATSDRDGRGIPKAGDDKLIRIIGLNAVGLKLRPLPNTINCHLA